MKADKDGGPAFPAVFMEKTESGTLRDVVVPGMSLRDWFAGQSLAGLVSSWYDRYANDPATQRGSGPADISLAAYAHADAMLAAREKGTK